MSRSTILDLFAQIDGLPFGAAERSLIDRAIAIADESGEDALAYEARMRLTASAKMTGDTDAMLASFGWCLGMHDRDPARFPLRVGELDLLWQFKWMAGTLGASPLFPRSEIEAVLTEMETRYRRAGVGMSGVLQARFDDAVDNLGEAEAELARAALRRAPRDEYSHCDACVRSEDAAYLASVGREAEALGRFEEIVDQNLSCGEEPETALSRALLPWLRVGDFETAKAAHLRSYRLARSSSDNIGIIANHLVFCAVTGNEARGLTLLERHIGWLAHDSLNARAHFAALRSFGVLLDAVVRSGHGDATVRGADASALVPFFGSHDGEWTAADLAAASWAAAERLAHAFDERNGNDRHRRRVDESRALAAEHYDVPVQGEGVLPGIPMAAEADPVDAAGWLVRARELIGTGAYGDSVAAARQGLEASRVENLPSDLTAPGRIRSSLFAVLIQALIAAGELDEAAARQIDRIAVLRDMGWDDQADVEVVLGLILLGTAVDDDVHVLEMTLQAADGRQASAETRADLASTLGSVHLQAGRAEEALVLFRRAAELLEETPDSPAWSSVLMFLAHALARADELAEAVATIDRLLELPLDRAFRAAAQHLLAQLAGAEGEIEPGLAAADAALALWTRLGHRSGMVDSAVLSASLLRDAGRLDEAVTRWRLAVREAELAERPDVDGLRYGFGRLLVQAGQAEAAAE
jgi:tetratricopeptide (TPR) repeat protein